VRASVWRRSLVPVVALFFAAVCWIAIHPFGRVKQFDPHPAGISDLTMPLEVKTLIRRSCQDCHSSQTVWPWYSYVPPASWLIERDVGRGRDHLNFSGWARYSAKEREKLLADIASVVKNHEMPLPQYELIHLDAKLSEAEIDILYQWARLERRKLKASSTSSPSPKLFLGQNSHLYITNR